MQCFATARLGKGQGAALLGRIVAASRDAGLLRPAVGQSLVRLCWFSIGFSLCLYLAWFSTSAVLIAGAFLGLSYFVSQLAFLAHSALHGAISADRRINLMFGQVSMTVFAGLGFEEWKNATGSITSLSNRRPGPRHGRGSCRLAHPGRGASKGKRFEPWGGIRAFICGADSVVWSQPAHSLADRGVFRAE